MSRKNWINITACIAFCSMPAPAAEAQSWAGANSMSSPRYAHASALLPDGRVLVTGGYGAGGNITAAAEIYNPATGGWAAANPMSQVRAWATAALLPDGRVLVAGGSGQAGAYLSSAEIFDYRTGQWAAAASMATPRYRHTATLMFDGRVLVAGGYSNGLSTKSAEVYSTDANAWDAAPDLPVPRYYHAAVLLPNGKVLISGGYLGANNYLTLCNLFNPETNAWANAAPLAQGRYMHTATLLPDGMALAAGGAGGEGGVPLETAEKYDPENNLWTDVNSMATKRYYHTATLLPDGKLLVAGGISSGAGAPLSSVELYNYQDGAWAAAASMGTARKYHVATLLPDGRVLVTGGHNGSSILQTAELYSPEPGYDEAAKPIVEESPQAALPEAVITLRGQKLCGVSEASGGNYSASSPSNVPFVRLARVSDAAVYNCIVTAWKPSGEEASCAVPAGLSYGSYTLTVIANAVPSDPVPIEIGYPSGHPCAQSSDCQAGVCSDGVCCDSDCSAACFSCNVEGSAGTCVVVPYGDDPDEDCGGIDACNGFCDGTGGCAYPGLTTSCGNCLACDGTGGCGMAAAGTACNDQVACTDDDRCDLNGNCAGRMIVCTNPPNDQCYNAMGACADGECTYTTKGFGIPCDDGDNCTVDDMCDGAGECGGTAKSCDEPPNADCYEEGGVCLDEDCLYTPRAQGVECDDANDCTSDDRCDGEGSCAGTEAACSSPPNEKCYEAAGECEAGGCVYDPKAQGEPCDDEDPCTQNDACDGSGACAGAALQCTIPPNLQCYEPQGQCAAGQCQYSLKPADSQCDDSDPCTEEDACDWNGACAGKPIEGCVATDGGVTPPAGGVAGGCSCSASAGGGFLGAYAIAFILIAISRRKR